MKKIFFLALILSPQISFCQRTFKIVATFANTSMHLPGFENQILKTKGEIIVDDTSITVNAEGTSEISKIIKKINPDYFKITDGLQESIVKISEGKNGDYNGSISFQSDKALVIFFYK